MANGRLEGKIAIVTGAASGFGEGIARRFAAEGAKVIVNDINVRAGERVAEDIRSTGAHALFVAANVSIDADVARLVQSTLDAHGRLDAVVNNAGTTHRNRPLLEVTEAEFDRIYAVNVKSLYLMARHAVPPMRRDGGGVFV